jgi:hypothetical protein
MIYRAINVQLLLTVLKLIYKFYIEVSDRI